MCQISAKPVTTAKNAVMKPVALFFGAGTLYNRDEREYLVKAFPVNIRFDADRVHLACYFPMPFLRSAHIELVNTTDTALYFRQKILAPFLARYLKDGAPKTDQEHCRVGKHKLIYRAKTLQQIVRERKS